MGLRVIYFGTPDFAVETLVAIANSTHEIVGVVTAPDKPAGRGMKLQASAVKQAALELGVPIAQPVKLKDPAFHEWLDAARADIYVVVAFRMMPEVVWNRPRLGTFNLHGSLLPKYRGAAPINWAIMNGEAETGITTFFLKHEIDTGNVIDQQAIALTDESTFGDVYNELKVLGAQLVVKTLNAIVSKTVVEQEQETLFADDMPLPFAPKLSRENTQIDWSLSGRQILRFIHGLNPFPGAWSPIIDDPQSNIFKLFKVNFEAVAHNRPSGLIAVQEKKLVAYVRDGVLHIELAQLPGKKRMTGQELANGLQQNSIQLAPIQ